MISLKEMSAFKEKIVISLHDMWFLTQQSIMLQQNSHAFYIQILLGTKKFYT